MWEYLFSYGTIGWVGGTAGLTGVILLLILFVMFICSLPIVRRKGKFEIFYWSHNLFVIWYIVLILHGPHFWKWFIGPAVIYITERILRSKILKIIQYGRTYIEEVNLLPSKVSTCTCNDWLILCNCYNHYWWNVSVQQPITKREMWSKCWHIYPIYGLLHLYHIIQLSKERNC